jgi:Tfp pilus assembly ATPase PilU
MDLETLLDRMAATGATSLYLSSSNPPIFRIDGILQLEGEMPLAREGVAQLLAPILSPGQAETALQGGAIPVRITHGKLVVDGQVFSDALALAAAFHKV